MSNGIHRTPASQETATELHKDNEKIDMWPTEDLLPHPFNALLYENACDPGMIASVREHGIYQPLIITINGYILSGHQRLEAAKLAGAKEVPVIVKPIMTEEEIERTILDSNVGRKKTNEERLREYREFKRIESQEARGRQGYKAEFRANLPGTKSGRAREIAASKVGFKPTTAEHGLKVLNAIAPNGTVSLEHRERLRKILNEESIDGAYNEAVSLGLISHRKGGQTDRAPASGGGEGGKDSNDCAHQVAASADINPDSAPGTFKPPSRTKGEMPLSQAPTESYKTTVTTASAVESGNSEQSVAVSREPAAPLTAHKEATNSEILGRMPLPDVENATAQDNPMFTFADGSVFPACQWQSGWVSPEQVTNGLVALASRLGLPGGTQHLSELQRDLASVAAWANQRGGIMPDVERLEDLEDSANSLGNWLRIAKLSLIPPQVQSEAAEPSVARHP